MTEIESLVEKCAEKTGIEIVKGFGASLTDLELINYTKLLIAVCVDYIKDELDVPEPEYVMNEWQRGRDRGLRKAIESLTNLQNS